MTYADDITITSTHKSASASTKYTQPYLYKVFSWTKHKKSHTKSRQYNLHSVHSRSCGIYTCKSNLELKINNITQHMATHPKILELTIVQNSHSAQTWTRTKTSTNNKSTHRNKWGKQKETLMATYKAVMRPALGMPLPNGRLLHPRPALTNNKSC